MKIGIVGLGLIGGSILKSLKKNSNHLCYGYNRNKKVLEQAKDLLTDSLDERTFAEMNVVFLCITPKATIEFMQNNIDKFAPNSIIVDVCGIKQYIVEHLEQLCRARGIHFIGGHPMAGKEVGGFENATATLFNKASFIITPTTTASSQAISQIEKLVLEIGFQRVVKSSPLEHDKIIAYTSQLAHIVSNAYIKSPTLKKHKGFSGGSFEDLTRVAQLDSHMWTELFLLNKENLLEELELLITNLCKYKVALSQDDEKKLEKLLEQGSKIKIESLSNK